MKPLWPMLVLVAGIGCSKAPTDTASSATVTVPTSGFVEARLRKSEGALPDLLALHAKKAKELGLVPYAELGATWCEPCRELEASMGDARMKDAFKGTYIVHLDIDEWGGSLGKSGLASSAVPAVFALDPQSGKGTSRSIDGSAWDANTAANMAPKLGAFFHGR